MSDRIAVVNEGRIEQVGDPEQVYEQPGNAFVAGFVGISNVIERPAGRFTIRPEKIRTLAEGEAGEGLVVETGTISEVSYAGMVTRLHVDLDAGGAIQVARQNTETTSQQEDESLPGRQVRVGWQREHAVAVGDQSGNTTTEEER